MDSKIFSVGGYEHITQKITEAIKNESRTATISGNFEISKAIRLPSHFTLILENAHLKMADDVYDNMFINEQHGTELGTTTKGTDQNINIIGRGEAILDGGKYNGLSEQNHSRDGMPPIWKNNLLLFTNVNGFHISGISCRNQRWWALNFIYCRNGYLGNIDFCACDIGIDENGNAYHGLLRQKYSEVLIKNADGIDLRQGCHDITIENITGFTEDDTIALTGLNGRLEQTFSVEGLPLDICNITIKNICASAFCTIVRLLNQGDVKLHDIVVEDIYDTSAACPHLDKGIYAVRVGDTHLYGTRHATEDETYNITIRNVRGRGKHVISLAGEIGNLVMHGIEAFDGAMLLRDARIKKE